MRVNKSLSIIYVLATINIVLFLLCTDICLYPDTGSYIDAAVYLREGRIHPLRTPIYPIYLGVMRTVFGQGLYMKMAVIIQAMVFLVSIRYFYKSVAKVVDSKYIVFFLTLFYALCTGTFTWCDTILTEPFALAGSVFFVYYTICLYEKYSMRRLLEVTGTFVFLVILRPAFVYLIGVMFVVWTINYLTKEKKKEAMGGLVSVCITTVVLLSYMFMFQQSYGVFATSRVSIQNRESNYRAYGLYNPEVISDENFREDVIKSYQQYGQRPQLDYSNYYKNEVIRGWSGITSKYSFATRQDALDQSLLSHPLQNIKSVGGRTVRAAYRGLFANYTKKGGGYYNIFADYIAMFNVKFVYLYAFLLVYIIVIARWLCHHKKWAFISTTLLLTGAANLFVAIAGAQDEWPRLILPSIPIYLMMLGQLCNFLTVKESDACRFK